MYTPYISIYNSNVYRRYGDPLYAEILYNLFFGLEPDWVSGYTEYTRYKELYEAGLLPPEYRYEYLEFIDNHRIESRTGGTYMKYNKGPTKYGGRKYLYTKYITYFPQYRLYRGVWGPFYPEYYIPIDDEKNREIFEKQALPWYKSNMLAYVDGENFKTVRYWPYWGYPTLDSRISDVKENREEVKKLLGWRPPWEALLKAMEKAMLDSLLRYSSEGFEYAVYKVPCPFHLDHTIEFIFPIYEEVASLLHHHPELKKHLSKWGRYWAIYHGLIQASVAGRARPNALMDADVQNNNFAFNMYESRYRMFEDPLRYLHQSHYLFVYDEDSEWDDKEYPKHWYTLPFRFYESDVIRKYFYKIINTDIEELDDVLWKIVSEYGDKILRSIASGWPTMPASYYDFYVKSLLNGYYWDTNEFSGYYYHGPYSYNINTPGIYTKAKDLSENYLKFRIKELFTSTMEESPFDVDMPFSTLLSFSIGDPHNMVWRGRGVRSDGYMVKRLREILIYLRIWGPNMLRWAFENGYLRFRGEGREPPKTVIYYFKPGSGWTFKKYAEDEPPGLELYEFLISEYPPITRYLSMLPYRFKQALGYYILYNALYHLYRYYRRLSRFRIPSTTLPSLSRSNPLALMPLYTVYRYNGTNGIFSVGVIHYSSVFPIRFREYWMENRELNEKYYRNPIGSPYYHAYIYRKAMLDAEKRGPSMRLQDLIYNANLMKLSEIYMDRTAVMVGYDPIEGCGATFEAVVYPGSHWYIQMERMDKARRWYLKPYNGEPGPWFKEGFEHGYSYVGFDSLPDEAYPNRWKTGYIVHRQLPFTEAYWDRELISRDIAPQPLNIVYTYVARNPVFYRYMVRNGEIADFEEAKRIYRDLYPIEPEIRRFKPEEIKRLYKRR